MLYTLMHSLKSTLHIATVNMGNGIPISTYYGNEFVHISADAHASRPMQTQNGSE